MPRDKERLAVIKGGYESVQRTGTSDRDIADRALKAGTVDVFKKSLISSRTFTA